MTRSRTYTVQHSQGVPFLTIRGNFLPAEFGVDVGTQLQLIEGKNMMVLLKVPAQEVERKQNLKRLAELEKEVKQLRTTPFKPNPYRDERRIN